MDHELGRAAPGSGFGGGTPIAARRGALRLVAGLGEVLVVLSAPVSVIWIPVARVPGAGNVTVSDAALVGLWALVAAALVLRGLGDVRAHAPSLALLATAIGVFAAIGSSLSGGIGPFEFSLTMKRFGLASILPLAAILFRSRATGTGMRLAAAGAVTALAVFTLFPDLQAWLPRPDAWDDVFAGEGRAVGPLTNPNDLAYAAIGLAFLHGALLPRRLRLVDRVLLAVTLGAAATCVVSSGSRSAFLGLVAGLAFVLTSSRVALATRAVVLVAGAALFLAGMTWSTIFESRLTRAYRLGLSEENISSRLDAQVLAASLAVANPLGVGFTSFERVSARTSEAPFTTADSVYFDTLLGAGFPGLLCLLALVGIAWRHVGRAAAGASRPAALLRGGLVAFLVFGTATVVPISVFLAPIFFSLVGAASCADPDGAA